MRLSLLDDPFDRLGDRLPGRPGSHPTVEGTDRLDWSTVEDPKVKDTDGPVLLTGEDPVVEGIHVCQQDWLIGADPMVAGTDGQDWLPGEDPMAEDKNGPEGLAGADPVVAGIDRLDSLAGADPTVEGTVIGSSSCVRFSVENGIKSLQLSNFIYSSTPANFNRKSLCSFCNNYTLKEGGVQTSSCYENVPHNEWFKYRHVVKLV